MKVILFGATENIQELHNTVKQCLDELGLTDFLAVELSQDASIKDQLNISSEPALIIEEESIDFKDVIFQGIVPDAEEIKSMFISIIGGGSGGGC
jgi:hypothetical protein